jgi:hypothetical protein
MDGAYVLAFFRNGAKEGGLYYMEGAYVLAFFRNGAKEGGLYYMEGAYVLVFFRNGANLAHYFRQMPMRQKSVLGIRIH